MTKPKQPWRCQRCTSTGVLSPRAYPRSKICAWCANELANAGLRWCTTGRHGSADWTPNNAMCRACQAAYNAAYRAEPAHHAKAIAVNRAYANAHRDAMIAAGRARYAANRGQLLAQKKVYYQEKRELLKAKAKAHRPFISAASRAKNAQRQREKGALYYQRFKLARARRFIASLRGAQ